MGTDIQPKPRPKSSTSAAKQFLILFVSGSLLLATSCFALIELWPPHPLALLGGLGGLILLLAAFFLLVFHLVRDLLGK